MRNLIVGAIALVMASPLFAQTIPQGPASASVTAQQLARPPAPVVTAGANIKELTFDWEPVPGAYTYWVMEKKDARSSFTPIGVRIPAGRPRAAAPVAVHLQNWAESRYAIAACNTAGCTRSVPINPQPLMPETIGYFKASNTNAGDLFGASVVLSGDGSTLAVGAPGEASNATGVNGNQASNSTPYSGAVYIYRRDGRRWKQEAYLKGSVTEPNQSFGVSDGYDQKAIAVSGDGSWVAVGAPGETVDGTVSPVVSIYSDAGRMERGRFTRRCAHRRHFRANLEIASVTRSNLPRTAGRSRSTPPCPEVRTTFTRAGPISTISTARPGSARRP